jgi:hypothetical protein
MVVVDGDTVAYKACFATQYQTYSVPSEELAFRYLKEIEGWLALNFDADERPDYEKVQVVEPINHTYHIVNKIIEGIKEDTNASGLNIFISGDTNYRKHIPYPVVYKGHRPEKPIYLPQVRQYLVERYGAVVCNGYEADDALGMIAGENPDCIMAHVDKDIFQVPGKHYHLDHKEITEVSEIEGFRNFYKQMLMGDRADNILGCKGVGIKTAEKMIDKLSTQASMDSAVRQKYKEHFGEDWYKMFRSNYDLLWILRSKQELEEVIKEYGKNSTVKEGEGEKVATVASGPDTTSVQSA